MGLLQHVVAGYNDGVRTRDFGRLFDFLADTAVLELVDLPGTSLHGKPVVALAFIDAAPAQELVLRTLSANGDGVFATFLGIGSEPASRNRPADGQRWHGQSGRHFTAAGPRPVAVAPMDFRPAQHAAL